MTKTLTWQTSNVVVANYELGGDVTRWDSLNIQGVKAALVEATEEVTIAQVVVTPTASTEQS